MLDNLWKRDWDWKYTILGAIGLILLNLISWPLGSIFSKILKDSAGPSFQEEIRRKEEEKRSMESPTGPDRPWKN